MQGTGEANLPGDQVVWEVGVQQVPLVVCLAEHRQGLSQRPGQQIIHIPLVRNCMYVCRGCEALSGICMVPVLLSCRTCDLSLSRKKQFDEVALT
jgi:hypothetical protein